jgi:hypothetical protein
MRRVLSVTCLAYVVVAVACSDATAPGSPLVGGWMAPRENLQPRGSFTTYLGFSESKFTYAANSYGLYGGDSPGTLSAYTNLSGTYQIDGDKLVLTANRLATWDSFYGRQSRERVEQVNLIVFEQARFRIVGGTLILDYITYPADAPEATTRSFTRLGLD